METIELIMGKLQYIDIEFTSFVGAAAVYALGVGWTSQYVSGVITPAHFPDAQKTMRDMLVNFDDDKVKFVEFNELN